MAIRTIDPHSGAILFVKTAEEKQLELLSAENKELRSELDTMKSQLEEALALFRSISVPKEG